MIRGGEQWGGSRRKNLTDPLSMAFSLMVLICYNISVGITTLFVPLPVFGMFFCSHLFFYFFYFIRTIILTKGLSSLTYEKDCVRFVF